MPDRTDRIDPAEPFRVERIRHRATVVLSLHGELGTGVRVIWSRYQLSSLRLVREQAFDSEREALAAVA